MFCCFYRSLVQSLFWIVFCLLGSAAWALSQTVTVGDPQHPAGLPGALEQAYNQGARDLTIAPGIYDFPVTPPSNTGESILLDHWSGTVIHATDVTLIFEDVNRRPIHLRHCANVTWGGGTFLFVHPSFTQGRITAIGTDDKGETCDWQIDAGYPTNIDPVKSTYDVVDQQTRLLKVDTGDWAPESAELVGPGLYRFHYSLGRAAKFAVGDWLVTRAPGGSSVFHLDDCQACTLEKVTLQNAGFAAFSKLEGPVPTVI